MKEENTLEEILDTLADIILEYIGGERNKIVDVPYNETYIQIYIIKLISK